MIPFTNTKLNQLNQLKKKNCGKFNDNSIEQHEDETIEREKRINNICQTKIRKKGQS